MKTRIIDFIVKKYRLAIIASLDRIGYFTVPKNMKKKIALPPGFHVHRNPVRRSHNKVKIDFRIDELI